LGIAFVEHAEQVRFHQVVDGLSHDRSSEIDRLSLTAMRDTSSNYILVVSPSHSWPYASIVWLVIHRTANGGR
jgi:hypothetical protein